MVKFLYCCLMLLGFSGVTPSYAAVVATEMSDQNLDLSQAIKLPSGLSYIDRKTGQGTSPKPGEIAVVKYTGWILSNGKKGDEFDSSKAQGKPVQFVVGKHRVILAWDEGVASMKIGGIRTLIVPPQLGYGDRGAGGIVPPGASLLFDVELIAIKPPPVKPELDHPI